MVQAPIALKINTEELSEHSQMFQHTMSGSIDFVSLNWKIGEDGIREAISPLDKRKSRLFHDASIDLKDLKVLKQVGQGASATVCMAEYKGKKYALKIINGEDQKNCYKNSRTEIDCLRIIDSPYIVQMHQAMIRNNKICIMIDYMGCGSLERALNLSKRRWDALTLSSISFMVLSAMKHLRSKNIIHRDIKPANLLLEPKGYVKLTDFGLAKILQPGEVCTEILGTFQYMALEQLNYEGYDFAADVWSFGMTMAELFYGKFPFPVFGEDQFKKILREPGPMWKKSDFIHMPDLYDLITKCTHKDPESRPTPTELLQHPFVKRTDALYRNQILGKFIATNHLSTAKQHTRVRSGLNEFITSMVLDMEQTRVVTRRKRSNAVTKRNRSHLRSMLKKTNSSSCLFPTTPKGTPILNQIGANVKGDTSPLIAMMS